MAPATTSPRASYWLTRMMYTRAVAALYALAFAISAHQHLALLGSRGLDPICPRVRPLGESQLPWRAFMEDPTLFRVICNDTTLLVVPLCGVLISAAVCVWSAAPAVVWLALYLLYLSIVNLHSSFYAFGWHTQLLETGFWMTLATPWLSLQRLRHRTPTPIVWWGRWLLFKIMLGAGLIKWRGASCWRDFSAPCLAWHYETQPNPHRLSPLFHFTPMWFHAMELGGNHIAELLAPWMLLAPWRCVRMVGATIIVVFMATIMLSGNLAWLNPLTMAPAIWAFDDAFWACFPSLFPSGTIADAAAAEAASSNSRIDAAGGALGWLAGVADSCRAQLMRVDLTPTEGHAGGASHQEASEPRGAVRRRKPRSPASPLSEPLAATPDAPFTSALPLIRAHARAIRDVALALILLALNEPIVRNLLSPQQDMNRSYSPWHLASTYGAFGSVHKVRTEIVVLGAATADASAAFREYEWVCKPGALSRAPCTITPFHLTNDWLAWFAGSFYTYQQAPWVVRLVSQLLEGGSPPPPLWWLPRWLQPPRTGLGLLSHDPFAGALPPRVVKVDKYEYRWTPQRLARAVRTVVAAARATPNSTSSGAVAVALDAATDICRFIPRAWGWRVLSRGKRSAAERGRPACASATVLLSDDGSGRYLRVEHSGGVVEVGTWWSRRWLENWMPALEARNPSVRAFLEGRGLVDAPG